MRKFVALALVAGLLPACVWNPADQSTQTRGSPVFLSGFASAPGAAISIRAFNYAASAEVPFGPPVVASTGGFFTEPHLYPWDAGYVDFPDDFWVPPGAPCSTTGMLSLRIYEGSGKLATFHQGQKDCVWDEVWVGGQHPVHAAQTCGYDRQILVFGTPTC